MKQPHLPRHVAIIMDGNGRWAHSQGEPRIFGHREGVRSVHEVVRTAREIGISALTLFAFSEQNWERPPDEIDALMELLFKYVLEKHDEIMQNSIRLTTIGEVERLPLFVRKALSLLIEESRNNQGMILCLALSYGGREEIAGAVRQIAKKVQDGKIKPEDINENIIENHLFTSMMPPLDLLIRTSGEFRISNFLLWQAAYTELYFTPTMWPEFRREHLLDAIAAYQSRERRFGLTTEQLMQK